MPPPLQLGLGMGLAKSGGPLGYQFANATAEAYVAAVQSDGITDSVLLAAGLPPWSVMSPAIDTFFAAGDSDGWLSSIKRLYFPIWPAAAPDARCMVSGTSGTFSVSGVTHAAGYVQGDGSTGYFDMGTSMAGAGLSQNDAGQFALQYDAVAVAGVLMGVSTTAYISNPGIFLANGRAINRSADPWNTGIKLWSNISTTGTFAARRVAAGWFTDTAGATTGMPAGNVYAMARNNAGISAPDDSKLGAYGLTTEISAASAGLFTAALKTMWETCTGLTLP